MKGMYFEVRSPNGTVHFESLQKQDAVNFAQVFYKESKGTICEIHEIERKACFYVSGVLQPETAG